MLFELAHVVPATKVQMKHSQPGEASQFVVLVFKEPLTPESVETLKRVLKLHLSGADNGAG